MWREVGECDKPEGSRVHAASVAATCGAWLTRVGGGDRPVGPRRTRVGCTVRARSLERLLGCRVVRLMPCGRCDCLSLRPRGL
mgnify:CR=1 FL=1